MNMDKKELMFLIAFLTRTVEQYKPKVKKMMLSKTTNQEHIEKVVDEVEKLGIILDKLNRIMEEA